MRQIISPYEPDSSGNIILTGDTYKHLSYVLRKKVGDTIDIRTPSGRLLKVEITSFTKWEIRCSVLFVVSEKHNLDFLFVLLQWELKANKMDIVIRQATEVGATHIIPVLGKYSVSKEKNSKEKDRREKIVQMAREQSGSPVPTSILPSSSLSTALGYLDGLLENKVASKLLAYEKHERDSKDFFQVIEGNEEAIVLCIGAEGGISDEECAQLDVLGFKKLHFNTNILKAETAALYALSNAREIYFAKRGRCGN